MMHCRIGLGWRNSTRSIPLSAYMYSGSELLNVSAYHIISSRLLGDRDCQQQQVVHAHTQKIIPIRFDSRQKIYSNRFFRFDSMVEPVSCYTEGPRTGFFSFRAISIPTTALSLTLSVTLTIFLSRSRPVIWNSAKCKDTEGPTVC